VFRKTKEVWRKSRDWCLVCTVGESGPGSKGSGTRRESHQQLILCGGHSSTCPASTTACDGRMCTSWWVSDGVCYVIIIGFLGYIRTYFSHSYADRKLKHWRNVTCRKSAVPWLFTLSSPVNAVHSLPTYCLKLWLCIIPTLTFSSP
jgi:hypothetical protein